MPKRSKPNLREREYLSTAVISTTHNSAAVLAATDGSGSSVIARTVAAMLDLEGMITA